MYYKRVLLKLSGQSLGGDSEKGLSPEMLAQYSRSVGAAVKRGLEIAIVVGGGNIFRGLSGAKEGLNRAKADQIGMLATVINAMALAQTLESQGTPAVVLSATMMEPLLPIYTLDRAHRFLSEGKVVLIAGGTGNPFFTTDTAAALRAAELQCDVLLKGTRVDGVYTGDPEKDPRATRFDRVTFRELYERQLQPLDLTAITMCEENRIALVVFDMNREENLDRLCRGEDVGTTVYVG